MDDKGDLGFVAHILAHFLWKSVFSITLQIIPGFAPNVKIQFTKQIDTKTLFLFSWPGAKHDIPQWRGDTKAQFGRLRVVPKVIASYVPEPSPLNAKVVRRIVQHIIDQIAGHSPGKNWRQPAWQSKDDLNDQPE